ncbi:MAG: hypothetical protein Q9207_006853 [Kuettlingeria erythrocarpa]
MSNLQTPVSYHAETMPGVESRQKQPNMNPFPNVEPSQNTSQGGSGIGRGDAGANMTGNKFAGPYGVTARSQLGQLLDTSGKGVSQQVSTDALVQSAREQLSLPAL